MGIRTVRLDHDAEQTLDRIRTMTGLSITDVLKHGMIAYEAEIMAQAPRKPYEIFCQLDLGPGGYAITPARNAKSAIAEVIRRKHAR